MSFTRFSFNSPIFKKSDIALRFTILDGVARAIKIENVFAHLKVMRILKDTIRNYKKGFKDLVIQTAAALYNFRNNYKRKTNY